VGFGEKTPSPKWPSNAKVALNFVINYEEGGESCILHGDTKSESLLSDIVGAVSYGTLHCQSRRGDVQRVLRSGICLTFASLATEGERHPNMESLYDYGSRSGFWRLHRLFTSRKVPCTVFAVGMVRHMHSCASICARAHAAIEQSVQLTRTCTGTSLVSFNVGTRAQSSRVSRSQGNVGLGSGVAWISLARLSYGGRGYRARSHLAHGANS
jgi:hypothetical protein